MFEKIFCYEDHYQETDPLHLIMVGYSDCDENYCIYRRNPEFHTIEYMITGTTLLDLDGKSFSVGQGKGYYMPQGKEHRYRTPGGKARKLWVCFCGDLFFEIAGTFLSNSSYILEGEDLFDSMKRIFRYASCSKFSFQKIHRMILSEIFQVFLLSNTPKAPFVEEMPSQVRQYIHQHIESPFCLDDLCHQFSYSKNYIITSFRNSYGVTPYEYYTQCRLQTACRYLSDTLLPISEISDRLQFSSPQHFGKSFKASYGICPRTFRKNCNQ